VGEEWCWWKHGVVYQVYPRSFQDSDGDGIGDLAGIESRLDYLSGTLGIDAIWLSPFYRSPMADFGYDVTDHCDVDPIFGTMEDAERLIEACHGRGLRLIVDFVPNHTSDRHPWFQAARSSRDDPRRDWYFWRPRPTTGWRTSAGGRGPGMREPGSTTSTCSCPSSPI
jgi:alpha-glucosidase